MSTVDYEIYKEGEFMAIRGRPCKINYKVISNISLMLRSGNYIETACAFAGISKVTYYNWLNKGKKIKDRIGTNDSNNSSKIAKIAEREQIYLDFLNAVERANAIAEVRHVQIIQNATQYDYRAAIWFLSRRYPERWG